MRVPKYRLHKPTGQAVVTINGKDHYLGRHASKPSKQLYDRLIAEWLAGGRSEVYGKTTPSITVAEIALAYIRHAKKYYGVEPSSEWHRIKPALRPLAKLYSRLPAADFGPKQFKATRENMILLDWSRNGINANMRRITRMFRWAVGEGGKIVAVVSRSYAGMTRIRFSGSPRWPPCGRSVSQPLVGAPLGWGENAAVRGGCQPWVRRRHVRAVCGPWRRCRCRGWWTALRAGRGL